MPRNDSRSIMYASFFTIAIAFMVMPATSLASHGFEDEDTISCRKTSPISKSSVFENCPKSSTALIQDRYLQSFAVWQR